MKHCPLCDTDKVESDFYPDSNRGDGLSGYCRMCNRRKVKLYHQAGAILRDRHRPEFDTILGDLWLSEA